MSVTTKSIAPKNNGRATQFGEWVIRWRWFVILFSLLVVAGVGAGASKLYMKNDYRIFFGADNPQLKSFESLQAIYTKDDNILFVLEHPEKKAISAEFLTAVQWLTEEAWKLPFATRVDSVTNFQHSYSEGDDLIVGDLVEAPSEMNSAQLAEVRRVAMGEPMLRGRLVGDNERVIGINAILTLPELDPNEAVQATGAARKLVERFNDSYPEYKVYLTGMVLLNNAFAESSIRDMSTVVPLMYLGILIAMLFLIRSIAGTIGALLVIVFSSVVAMGFMGAIGFPVTPPSAIAPTIITTLAIADSIHILVSLLYYMRQGLSKNAAIVESLRVNFQPVFLTSLTTAIGFLSMNFSDAPPFRHLGNVVAVGVAAAWFFSIGFLPALLSLLPLRERAGKETRESRFDAWVDFLVRRRAVTLWGSVTVVVFLAAFVQKINLDDRWVDYFAESISFRTDTDFVVDELTGIYTLEYSITAKESGGISEPEYLRNLDDFSGWLRKQKEVLQVVTISDTLKRLNKNLNEDKDEFYRIPESRDLAAQYLLLFEMSLPYGLDLNNQINVDKSASRLIVSLDDVSTPELRDFIDRAAAWQSESIPEYMRAVASSPSVMFAHISKRNIESMLGGTALAVLLISAILAFALRSLRYGAMSLIPNFVPAIMGFGAWGALVGSMGMSLSVVTGMTLGIVVDDTVHFLSKYLRARREQGMDAEGAIRYAFHSVGRALVTTTIILVIGFSVLSFSSFRLNSWMGQLTAIVISFALIADFIFLPALLLTFDRNRKPDFKEESKTNEQPNLEAIGS
jgi:predicted RND superfamily exporter protein